MRLVRAAIIAGERLAIRGCLVLLAFVLAALPAWAEEFPTRSIRVVVATAAGGASDLVARIVGQRLSEVVRQPVVVDPRPGANGNVAAELVAAAPADGYTLMVGTIGVMAINPLVYERVGYDPVRDFAPVAPMVTFGNILVLHPSVPADSVPSLIALARQKPGSLRYGSPGAGGSPHMAMVVFGRMAGIELVHVPYRGAAPALNDLLAGQIELSFSDAVATLPHVVAGRLRALAVSGATRLAAAPDIPTVAEAGLPGYDVAGWLGMVAPAATPPDRVAFLNQAITRVITMPDVTEKLVAQGATIWTGSPEKLGTFVKGEIARWTPIVREAGIRVQ